MFRSPDHVVHCLVTYTDWWQPVTTSLLQAPAARRLPENLDGFRPGLLDTLEEREELRRRVTRLDERERKLLFLWYVALLSVEEIARAVGVSRRHCFRLRASAVRAIVDVDPTEEVA